MNTKNLCQFLKINYESLPFSQYAFDCVETVVHYYRMKDLYDTYVNKKTYHYTHYRTFLYNYNATYDSINEDDDTLGASLQDVKNIISHLRDKKNRIIDIHTSNCRFFYHDRNIELYYVTRNLIEHFVAYYELIQNKSNFTIESEDEAVQNLLRAHYLFDYIQNKDISQNDAEFNRLINEKWSKQKSPK